MSEENDSPESPSPAADKQPVRKPAPKLAVPKLPARKIVLNAPGAIPASKVKLMSAGGKPVAPTKAAAAPLAGAAKPSPAAKKDELSPEEEARRREEEEARLRAEEEERRKAEEEYNRQMEEYNRQMEEYNRQMEEIKRQEEEARRREEEEARRKAEEEARKRAEEEKKRQAALAAQLEAEKEAKRKAAEAIRLQAEAARLEAEAAQMEAEALRAMRGEEKKAPAPTTQKAATKPRLTLPATAKTSAIPATKAGPAQPKLTLPGTAKTAAIPPTKAGYAQPKLTLPVTAAKTIAMPDPKSNAEAGGGRLQSTLPSLAQAKPADAASAPMPKPKLSLPTELTRPAGATLASEATAQEDAAAEPSEEEQAAREAYYAKLQQQASETPIYKRKGVLIGVGAFVILVGALGAMVVNNRMETAAKEEFRQSVNRLLRVSQEINKAGVETLAQAKAKNIDLKHISMENADTLLDSIHNPAKYGGVRVAQNAALFLGIMAEADERIQNKLFADLSKNAATINPTLFNWMLQRLSVSGIDSIKDKMLTLSDKIAKKPKFKNQAKAIASIWEVLALHVDEKDVPHILELLKNPKTDETVTKSLANSLMSVVLHAKNPQELPALGDKIFEAVPEERRALVGQILANSRSPKALAWIKNELKNQKKWAVTLPLLGIWGDDSVVDYLLERLEEAKQADPRYRLPTHVEDAIKNLLNKDRDRPLEVADKMIGIAFDKIGADTSDYISVRDKTEEGSVDYVKKGAADYDKLQARRKELDAIRRQKLQFVSLLSNLQNHPWVVAWFDKLAKDPDEDLQIEVKAAREKAAENTKKAAAKAAGK